MASLAFVALLLCIFAPRWESNDDIAMSMIAHGYGIATDLSPPYLMFSNIAWGYIVRAIPGMWGNLGYSIAALFVVFVCCVTLVHGLVRMGVSHFTIAALAVLVFTRPLLFPQFTINAGLLAVAALLCLKLFIDDHKVLTLVVACTLAFLSFLVRDHEFIFVAVVALPLIQWWELRKRKSAVIAGFVLLAAIVGASVLDSRAYRTQDWQPFNALNPVRAPLTDFRVGEDLRARQDILERFGFTQNDVQLVEAWFFADPVVANPDKLSAMLKELGVFSTRNSAIEGVASSLKALVSPVLLYLFVSAAILAIARPSWRVLGAWLLFTAGIVALGFLGRPGVFRVYIPALTLLLIAPYLAGKGSPRHGKICFAVLLAAMVLNAVAVFSESRSLLLSDRQIRGHMPRMPKEPLVVWGGGFPFEAMYPVLNPPVEAMAYKIYGFGVSTLAPFSVARQESLAGRGFVIRLTSDEGVPMIANEMLFGYLSIYCREHHQAVLEELKREAFAQYSMSWRRCKK